MWKLAILIAASAVILIPGSVWLWDLLFEPERALRALFGPHKLVFRGKNGEEIKISGFPFKL